MYARFLSPVVVRELNLGEGKDPPPVGPKATQMIDQRRKTRLGAAKASAQCSDSEVRKNSRRHLMRTSESKEH
jgi:hypothetical protein